MLNLKQIIIGQIRSIDDKYVHTEEIDDVTGVVSRCMYRKADYRIAYNDNNISIFNKNTDDVDKLKKVKSIFKHVDGDVQYVVHSINDEQHDMISNLLADNYKLVSVVNESYNDRMCM